MWKGILLFQCALDGAPSCLPLCLYNWSHSIALCQQAIWYIARLDFSQFLHVVLQLLLRRKCPWSVQAGWSRWPSEVPSKQFMVIWLYEKKWCVQSLYSSLSCAGETVPVCLMWGIDIFCAFVNACHFYFLWKMDTRCRSYLHLVPKTRNNAILNIVWLC